MTPEIRIAQSAEVRAVNRADRTIDIVASDSSIDSYQTRIDQNGWDLDQFKRNPVILDAHNDRTFPLANAIPETVRVEGGQLKMRLKFPPEGKYERADVAYELYADGFMRGVSVGFMPLNYEDRSEGEGDSRKNVRVYTEARLMEVSLVALPSNDNAFAQRCSQLNADLDLMLTRARRHEELIEAEPRHDPDYVEKCIGYFERKQKPNKAATRFLKKFYQARNEEIPADEIDAWEKAEELIEVPVVAPVVPIDETPEEKPAEPTETAETPKEEKPEETTTPSLPPEEAPLPEQKASVHISVKAIQQLPRMLTDAYTRAASEALKRGTPVRELDGFLDDLGEKLKASLLSQ